MALQEELERQGAWCFKHRSTTPLFILIIGIAVYLQAIIFATTIFPATSPYRYLYETGCLIVSLLGLVMRIYTVGYTPKMTSGRNTDEQIAHTLNTTGSYSIIRHPLYLANFFMWLGPALLTANLWFIIAFTFFYYIHYERIMFTEEQFLTKRFNTEFTDWAKNVPAFIPNLRKFKRPNKSFSWKKVLRQEKNGFLAVFLVFTAFNIAGQVAIKQTNYNYFLIIGSAFTLVLYLVLKYLKRRTTVLNEE